MKNTQKIILSFIFVLGTAFLTHYFFAKQIESKERDSFLALDREVASVGERNSAPQIKWEQKVADDLSESTSTQASVKPQWQDLLVYGYLAGQYDIIVHQGQIQNLKLQPSMNGVKFQTKDFIEKFGHKIKIFVTYRIESENKNNDQVQLFDQTGSVAGLVQVQRDDKGLVQNITIQ